MKKSHCALLLLAAVAVAMFLTWLFRSPPAIIRHVSLVIVTNSVAPGMAGFRLKNDEPLALFVSELQVEINTSGGWQTYQHLTPAGFRVVASGAFKDLPVPVPTVRGAWRLRATYGEEMRGPGLLLLKAEIALTERRLPGAGFGGFSGPDSAISPELHTEP